MIRLIQFVTIKDVARTLALLSFFVILACDPDDPIDPLPPPPPATREDTLLGTYSGQCITTESYLDFMTGEQVLLRDTIMHDIKLMDIDTPAMQYYHFQFEGTYFYDHAVSLAIYPQDTLTMHFLFGTHTENISMKPAEGLIITKDQHNNPFGFGSTTRECRCTKSL